ncbi:MAG: hypothetical protein V4612_06295 [Pseudomonadota bacterium]
MNNNKRTIGIDITGDDNKITDNEFINLDIGIRSKGANTIASGNKFSKTKNSKITKDRWHQKWWGQIATGLIISYIIYYFGWN